MYYVKSYKMYEVAYDRAHYKDLINKNVNGRRHRR